MFSKKGQKEGATVAIIIIIIALFMTLYILFVNPEERSKILNPDDGSSDIAGTNSNSPIIELLTESPGSISPNSQFGTKHSLQEANLYVKTEPKLETLAPNLVVKNGLFSSSSPTLKFKSEDFSDAKRITINFFVSEVNGGELRIRLNGQTVYSEELATTGAKIVDIALGKLQQDNELEFSVSSPGLAFWATNRYNLKDVVLKQEFSRINSKEERTFALSDSEASSLDSATLKYTQICNQVLPRGTSNLVIRLNDQRVSSGLISCVNTEQEIDLDKTLLVPGRNTLAMELENGDFSFKQLGVITKSSESAFPTYQFSLPSDEFQNVENKNKHITLQLFFSNVNSKKARIDLNNNEVSLDTSETSFSRDVSDLVVEGTNFLRIIPDNTFTITGLKVTLQ